MKKIIAGILISLLMISIAKLPATAQNKWTIDKILETERLKSPVISPDGKYVFYEIGYTSQGYPAKSMEFYTVSIDGDRTFNLSINNTASSYQWSPDSKQISYLDYENGDKGIHQIWSVPPTGGKSKQLTSSKRSIKQYAWSPSGAHLLYITNEPKSNEEIAYREKWGEVVSPEEKVWPQRGVLWLKHLNQNSAIKLTDEFYMPTSPKWSPDGRSIAFLSVGKGNQNPELYIIDIDGDKKPKAVTNSKEGVRFFSWSPDNKSIAYLTAKQNTPVYFNYYPNRSMDSQYIHLYDRETGSSRQISNTEYPELNNFIWSRDSKKLVFIAELIDNKNLITKRPYKFSQMYVISIDNGKVKTLAEGMDYYRGGIGITWSNDNSEIWFVNGDKIGYNIFAVNVSTGKVRNVTEGKDCFHSVTYNDDFTLASFTRENVNMKPDIYASALHDWHPSRITDINPWVDEFQNPQGDVITYRSEGRNIEALLIKPPGFNPNKKYPLILVLHGGPSWYKLNEWLPDWEQSPIHAYSAEDFVLLFPNVRGSANYGVEFRKENFYDIGGGDFRDAMRGVDYLIDMGYVDENKMGVSGWSYGGFLTPSIITQTDRFKAAQFGGGIPSLEALHARMPGYDTGTKATFDEKPWENGMTHLQFSPLYYANKVKTPTLIQNGDKDPRCPVAGAILFYKALKHYGVPTVLEIYPEMGHSITDPLLYKRILNKNLEWFKKWLKDDKSTSFEDVFPAY